MDLLKKRNSPWLLLSQVKTFLLGFVGCLLVSASSLYIALRLGALPWTLFFAALVSFVFLRKPEDGRLARINFAHTMMTSGSMVAGGIAFVLPALFLLGLEVSIISLIVTTVAGLVMGLFSCWYLRSFCLDQLQLDYPIGQAVYQTLSAYQNPTRDTLALFGSGVFAGIFSLLRDGLGYVPQTFLWGRASLSPMAFGLGYLMKTGALWWGASAVVTHAVVSPILLRAIPGQTVVGIDQIWKSLSLGMLITCGLMSIIKSLYKNRQIFQASLQLFSWQKLRHKHLLVLVMSMTLLALLISFLTPLTLGQSLLLIPCILVTNFISMILCGQTGINPLETFGIMIFLILTMFMKILPVQGVLIILCTAIASGLCGDLMNDFQVGRLSRTPPKMMFISEIIGAISGLFVCLYLFFIFQKTLGPWGTLKLPVPQATAIAAIINGSLVQEIFVTGLIIGSILGLSNYGLLIAIGIYLPMMISIPVGLGGLAFVLVRRKSHNNHTGQNIAGGLLVGEGIGGTILAISETLKMSFL